MVQPRVKGRAILLEAVSTLYHVLNTGNEKGLSQFSFETALYFLSYWTNSTGTFT